MRRWRRDIREDGAQVSDGEPGLRRPLDIVVVTGMSGAGRSTAAKCLEDLGWFVVDNLPPGLLETMADLGDRTEGAVTRIAAVVDVRSRAFTSDLASAIDTLSRRGTAPRILFLEASDDELVRRFENVRRPHPLQGDGRLIDGIASERDLLREVRGGADLVLDTSGLNVHELRAKIASSFSGEGEPSLRTTVVSFGYKYGLPVDADMVVDCRFLPNPHWIPALQPHNGLDEEVRDFVLAQKGAREFLDGYTDVLRTVTEGYRREGKRYVTVAVGCTGGKHRSVAIAEELGRRLRIFAGEAPGEGPGDDIDVQVVHRDLGRE
jgi:UPF0042 nucleotide-binding protein